jgi:hypothetical protein
MPEVINTKLGTHIMPAPLGETRHNINTTASERKVSD